MIFMHVSAANEIRLVVRKRKDLKKKEKKKVHLGFVLENRLREEIIIQMCCQNPWRWNLLHPL